MLNTAQLVGAVEYTDCISAEEQDHHHKCPVYNIKQSDCMVPVMLELWAMLSTPLLPSLLGPLWPEVVIPGRVLSRGQIVWHLHWVQTSDMLNRITWNRFVWSFNCKQTNNWIISYT